MHMEIHVAINYVMSQLYEKLPRRRVNIFGEELEKALKEKFEGHWYPDAPEKGSGYRCLKVGRAIDPPDPLLEKAAYDSGLEVQDILEHLPKELNIWIDPGEVSFRIGDKGATEILYSTEIAENSDNEVARTFNPEAKCFRPNDFTAPFNPLIIAKPASPASGSLSPVNGIKCCSPPQPMKIPNYNKNAKAVTPNNMHVFNQRNSTPTFTTATFAQTKFGSTKLKTNSKRTNRMSPTEFANYIKQRAQMQQQMQMQQHTQQQNTPAISPPMRSFGENFYSSQNNNFVFRNGGMDSSFSMDSLNRFSTFADDGTSQFFNQSNIGPLSPVVYVIAGFLIAIIAIRSWLKSVYSSNVKVSLDSDLAFNLLFVEAPSLEINKIINILGASLKLEGAKYSYLQQFGGFENFFNFRTLVCDLKPFEMESVLMMMSHLSRKKPEFDTFGPLKEETIIKCHELIYKTVKSISVTSDRSAWKNISPETLNNCLKLSAMFVQAVWDTSDPLIQLPHLEFESLRFLEKDENTMYKIQDIANLQSDDRRQILRFLNEEQFHNVVAVLDKFPKIKLKIHVEDAIVLPCEDIKIVVIIERRNLLESFNSKIGHLVHCPNFPQIKKERWWLYVANSRKNKLQTPPKEINEMSKRESYKF